ncbi:MAG TPA: NYN domain-containing protein [Anaerolineae bacterium]|nr:NYN domain-containing protein [Anaerolineae bacterium]
MPLLIDGHNLIGRCPGLSLSDPDDEEKLVRLLAAYASRTGKKVTVAFDPGEPTSLPRTRRLGGVEIVFAAPGTTADALILRRVQHARHPAGWTVVTSDVDLAERVARLGARTRSAHEFAAEACARGAAAEERQSAPSPGEVEAWLEIFKTKR